LYSRVRDRNNSNTFKHYFSGTRTSSAGRGLFDIVRGSFWIIFSLPVRRYQSKIRLIVMACLQHTATSEGFYLYASVVYSNQSFGVLFAYHRPDHLFSYWIRRWDLYIPLSSYILSTRVMRMCVCVIGNMCHRVGIHLSCSFVTRPYFHLLSFDDAEVRN